MASESSRETRLLLRLAVGCAVLMTGLAGARLAGIGFPRSAGVTEASVAVSDDVWDELIAGGHRFGPPDARVVIVEFGDFECPFCKGYALETLPAVRASYPNDVAVVYRHLPLSYHRFAMMSAVAAECAGRQGQFATMHDLLYAKQDSIGLLAWDDVARRSNVADLTAWEDCRQTAEVREIVEADAALAKRVGASGTPTVVINGTKYGQPPPAAELEEVIGELLAQ
ncbi:MAG: DsbA family protein [Thioalkalivibrio sp.]|nr:DsbA family protein [Thioalkalivibrio sp.]